MEFPEPGLDLHLDLGVRGADDQVAHRTIPAPSSPQPSLRDGLRQDPALNLCHDSSVSAAPDYGQDQEHEQGDSQQPAPNTVNISTTIRTVLLAPCGGGSARPASRPIP